jgi:hypothetical protein
MPATTPRPPSSEQVAAFDRTAWSRSIGIPGRNPRNPHRSAVSEAGWTILEVSMKVICIALSVSLAACSYVLAQSSGGTSAGSSAATGAGGSGSTLSNGSTISGTGGSPGPNTANALGKGTTGNNLGAPQTSGAGAAPASHGNAVDTPAANTATQSLGNTDAGVLKK